MQNHIIVSDEELTLIIDDLVGSANYTQWKYNKLGMWEETPVVKARRELAEKLMEVLHG